MSSATVADTALDVGALHDEHAPAMLRYLRRNLAKADAAVIDDLASAFWERVCLKANTYEDQGKPITAWLYRIAHNLVVDHIRKSRETTDLDTARGAAVADAGAAHHDTALDVAAVLGRLKPSHRAVLTERFIHGRTLLDTADVIGSTEDAVKKMQSRALLTARRVFDEPTPEAVTVVAEMVDQPTAASLSGVDARVSPMLADLEQQERDALKVIQDAQRRLLSIRGGLSVLRELATPAPGHRIRTVHAVPQQPKALAESTEARPTAGSRWSRDFDACTQCQRTTIKHLAKGLCRSCYATHRREAAS